MLQSNRQTSKARISKTIKFSRKKDLLREAISSSLSRNYLANGLSLSSRISTNLITCLVPPREWTIACWRTTPKWIQPFKAQKTQNVPTALPASLHFSNSNANGLINNQAILNQSADLINKTLKSYNQVMMHLTKRQTLISWGARSCSR
jgi:hypothetical protein